MGEPPRGVKGTQDILPDESGLWQQVESEAVRVFRVFGFREIRTPVMEYTEVFIRSIGETTDIVEKEMYTFRDKGDRSVTLRPEGTAPVVRSYVQHGLASKDPIQKLFYRGPMFRYERPQAGRYRQFHQIGAEAFGVDDPALDAEMLHMLTIFLSGIGLSGLDCQINSIGCSSCRPAYREALKNFLQDRVETLCEDCRRRFDTNPLRIMDCKARSCREAREGAPSVLDHLDDGCRTHFDKLLKILADLGVPHTVNPSLVRGLDYYTRTTFEVVSREGLGAQNAVAAGGRYDGLVADLGGANVPAIGFAVGVERLVSLIKDRQDSTSRPDLFIAAVGERAVREGRILAGGLRAKGVWTELGYGDGSLKSRMKRADRLGARRVFILGDEELDRGAGILRDMETKTQVEIPLADAIDRLLDR